MAFDQSTRNRLQKFVGDARKLLSDEFTRQLQNTYGLDPVTGDVSALSDLPNLSPSEQQTSQLLRDTLEHYLAASHKVDPHKDKALVTAALDRIVREQAFTVLNRLAALRMAEARQFVMESISQGYQSKGFQLYQRIAGSSLGETGQAYQHYLFSVFDELSLDLAVLFDRYSSQGRLFPRETVLLELLDLINHAELDMLWGEDETVGWIYQYFNSKEERKKMRDESQAPRNSRELAVRNQFFTPRYVVEFLTDNTLGRIWYEMTKGKTSLVDSCEYLVRRPNEVFLEEGEAAPEQENETAADLSREELLQQIVHIQHRPLKDPRDIKMLDPACGSMHFGLYAFDLFENIYSEAWDIEAEFGYEKFNCPNVNEDESNLLEVKSLHQSYESKESYLADVPKLIIEHNIHGVDIDPRAAQIAGLSLWLRAQKSWSDNAIKPNERPQVQRSNIVCAEPMPGEKELLKEFTNQIQPRVLGQLVEEIFEKMELAGETGTLLKIEEEIQSSIEDAKSQKDENILEVQGGLFGENKWEARTGKRYYNFGDVGDDFWGQAEQLILSQLERYAEVATGEGSGQKRLFASDAAKGFSFIDLSRKRFDVILMNPPFGDPAKKSKSYIKFNFTNGHRNIMCSFVELGMKRLHSRGKLGALTARPPLFTITFENWRKKVFFGDSSLSLFSDLGGGVLDDAMIEACCYTVSADKHAQGTTFESVSISDSVKRVQIDNSIKLDLISEIPGVPIAYWASRKILENFKFHDCLEGNFGTARQGLGTGDDFRFCRLASELPIDANGSDYPRYALGGLFSPYYEDYPICVNWKEHGSEMKAFEMWRVDTLGKPARGNGPLRESEFYLKPGLTFPRRTRKLCMKVMPSNTIFSVAGQAVFASKEKLRSLLPVLSVEPMADLAQLMLGNLEHDPQFEVGVIKRLPVPYRAIHSHSVNDHVVNIVNSIKEYLSYFEDSSLFISAFIPANDVSEYVVNFKKLRDELSGSAIASQLEVERVLGPEFGIGFDDDEVFRKIESSFRFVDDRTICLVLLGYLVGCIFGRFSIDGEELDRRDYFAKTDIFDPLSIAPPACDSDKKFNEEVEVIPVDYSDDSLVDRFRLTIAALWGEERISTFESGICSQLGVSSIGCIFQDEDVFFDYHLGAYSKGRRTAPIYWPLQIQSGKFTIWINYHKLNEQTLFTVLNDHVDPRLNALANTILDLKSNAIVNNLVQKELDAIEEEYEEVKNFQEKLLEVAEVWKPNFNDGVIINAAPLREFFLHKDWKKKLNKVWSGLEKGEYDWSGVALIYWPERVYRKSYEDRSISIAHGIQSDLWEEVEVSVTKNVVKNVWQKKQITEAELDSSIL